MTSWVLHVDLDQFVAAVEVLHRPELRGLPLVVGGDGDPTKRGVVSTASYEARAFGVQSGMPLRTAFKKCPEAVFVAVNAELYEAASSEVMATLRSFGAPVEVMGWDEAFLGVETDNPEEIAYEIQRRVLAETALHLTVGIGQNKLQAKLATGFGKPAGVGRLTHDTWFEVMGEMSTDALWGIGSKTAKRLAALGIKTVNELAKADVEALAAQIGPTTGPWLVALGRGMSSSTVTSEPYIARGRGRETTFQKDLEQWADVEREVATLARAVMEQTRRPVIRVVLKIRFRPFITKTRSRKIPETSDPAVVEQVALAILDPLERRPVRLVGVRIEFSN